MNVVSYFNPTNLERDNSGQLGLLTETTTEGLRFFAIESDGFDIWVNGLHGIKSFSLHIDNGSCSFTKDFRKSGDRTVGYWYACKRVNKKLKRLYFGTDFTKDKLMQIVDRLNPQQVTQEVTHEVELAGHGKSDRHIQKSLMEIVNDPIKILTYDNKQLERQNKDLNKRVIELSDKLAKIEKNSKPDDDHDNFPMDSIESLRREVNIFRQEAIEREKLVDNLSKSITTLENDLIAARDEAIKYQNDLFNLECESSKREDDVQGYAFMYEEHSDRIFNYQALIEKYRHLASGKTKKDNPRFAYLIDFLAEIDKLS